MPHRRESRSWNGFSRCWEKTAGPSSRCSKVRGNKAKAAVLEIRRTIGQAMASSRRRTHQGGQFVGRGETTCRAFAFRVGGEEPCAQSTQFVCSRGGAVAKTSGRVESTGGENYRVCPPKMRTVSTMLSSAEDLASWQEDPQRDFQDAIRFGLRNAVLEIPTQKRGCTR